MSQEQVDTYERDGFLVLKNFATEEECYALMSRMGALITHWSPQVSLLYVCIKQVHCALLRWWPEAVTSDLGY